MPMRALVASLLLLGGCDGALLQGLGEALVLVALFYLALLALGAAVQLAVIVLVTRYFFAGKPVPGLLKAALVVLVLLHGAVVADIIYGALRETGRADPLTWVVSLSLIVSLAALVFAWARPAPQLSQAWQATLGAAVFLAIFYTTGISLLLWPWTERTLPVTGEVVQLVDGSSFSCVLTDPGEVGCWGDNDVGQTGLGRRPRLRERPSVVTGLGRVERIVGGVSHACALSERRLWCWGANDEGQLGPSLPTAVFTPHAVPEAGDVVELGSWQDAVWARTGDGRLVGFGKDLSYQGQPGPHALGTLPADTVQTVVGEGFWCARRSSGEISCASAPYPAFEVGIVAVSLAATRSEACAALADGSVRCWDVRGVMPERQREAEIRARQAEMEAEYNAARVRAGLAPEALLGSDAPAEEMPVTLVPVSGLSGAVQIAASANHLCALTGAGEVWCWGEGFRGQLGDGSAEDHGEARRAELPVPARALHLSEDLSCAFAEGGRTFCWGNAPPGAPDEAYSLCHDTWLGELHCVAKPVEVRLLR